MRKTQYEVRSSQGEAFFLKVGGFSNYILETTPAEDPMGKFAYPQSALLIDDEALGSEGAQIDRVHDELVQIFSAINVDVHFLQSSQTQLADLSGFEQYDLTALVGDAGKLFSSKRKQRNKIPELSANRLPIRRRKENRNWLSTVRLNLVSESNTNRRRRSSKFFDATVCVKSETEERFRDLISMAYKLLQAFTIPSTLNIDFRDLGVIAKGSGVALSLSGDDPCEIISKLPECCFTARCGLNHFSCSEDVNLNEIYSISKIIALKRARMQEIGSCMYDGSVKKIRNLNLKFGIRIRENPAVKVDDYERRNPDENSLIPDFDHSALGHKRIEMTTVLFGIRGSLGFWKGRTYRKLVSEASRQSFSKLPAATGRADFGN